MDLQNFYMVVGKPIDGVEIRPDEFHSSSGWSRLVAGTTPMIAGVYPFNDFDLNSVQLFRVYPGRGWQGRWDSPGRYAATSWSIQSWSSDLVPVFGSGQNAVAASEFLLEVGARTDWIKGARSDYDLTDSYYPGFNFSAARAVAAWAFGGNYVLQRIFDSLLVWDTLPPQNRELIENATSDIDRDLWDYVSEKLPESRYDKLISEIAENGIPMKFEKQNAVSWNSRTISIPGGVGYGATYSLRFEQLCSEWEHMKFQLSRNAQPE